MSGQKLLAELMRQTKENPNSIADKLKRRTLQAQLQRYLAGETKEPRRTTIGPVAAHYGVNVEAFFNEEMAAKLLQQIETGEFVVKRRRAVDTPPEFPLLTHGVQITDALDMLADRINAIEDIAHRELIARRLQSMAVSPDSMKARNAVLEALTWANAVSVDQAQQANQIPGIAGRVLEQKLTTESKAFHPETLKT